MLFFLPEPGAALQAWRRLLVPGGRLGVSTFRPLLPSWKAVEELFDEYADDPGPRPTGLPEVYSTDEGVEGLLTTAGLTDVHTEQLDLAVRFADVEEWRAWSHGTAMRGLWLRAPEETHPEIARRVGELLRTDDGLRVDAAVRYTFGSA